MPISFQAEFFDNGDFTYRYNLSAIKSKIDSGVIPENFPSNIIIGTIPHFLLPVSQSPFPTSLFFRHLDPSDTPGSDCDGDGLILEDELFVYRTDPYNADSDYDAMLSNPARARKVISLRGSIFVLILTWPSM